MKNLVNLVIGLVVIVMVGLGCDGTANNSTNATRTTPAANSPANATAPAAETKPIAIQAKALTKEYDENELAADGKYKGKQLAVSGKISNIAETLGNVTVQLEGFNVIATVMCSFDDSEKAAVMTLKKGQQITLTGTGDGSTGGLYVGLQKCRIE